MAQLVNAQGAQIAALLETVSQLVEVVDVLTDQIGDQAQYAWARNTLNHNRAMLASGKAEAQAIIVQASRFL